MSTVNIKNDKTTSQYLTACSDIAAVYRTLSPEGGELKIPDLIPTANLNAVMTSSFDGVPRAKLVEFVAYLLYMRDNKMSLNNKTIGALMLSSTMSPQRKAEVLKSKVGEMPIKTSLKAKYMPHSTEQVVSCLQDSDLTLGTYSVTKSYGQLLTKIFGTLSELEKKKLVSPFKCRFAYSPAHNAYLCNSVVSPVDLVAWPGVGEVTPYVANCFAASPSNAKSEVIASMHVAEPWFSKEGKKLEDVFKHFGMTRVYTGKGNTLLDAPEGQKYAGDKKVAAVHGHCVTHQFIAKGLWKDAIRVCYFATGEFYSLGNAKSVEIPEAHLKSLFTRFVMCGGQQYAVQMGFEFEKAKGEAMVLAGQATAGVTYIDAGDSRYTRDYDLGKSYQTFPRYVEADEKSFKGKYCVSHVVNVLSVPAHRYEHYRGKLPEGWKRCDACKHTEKDHECPRQLSNASSFIDEEDMFVPLTIGAAQVLIDVRDGKMLCNDDTVISANSKLDTLRKFSKDAKTPIESYIELLGRPCDTAPMSPLTLSERVVIFRRIVKLLYPQVLFTDSDFQSATVKIVKGNFNVAWGPLGWYGNPCKGGWVCGIMRIFASSKSTLRPIIEEFPEDWYADEWVDAKARYADYDEYAANMTAKAISEAEALIDREEQSLLAGLDDDRTDEQVKDDEEEAAIGDVNDDEDDEVDEDEGLEDVTDLDDKDVEKQSEEAPSMMSFFNGAVDLSPPRASASQVVKSSTASMPRKPAAAVAKAAATPPVRAATKGKKT